MMASPSSCEEPDSPEAQTGGQAVAKEAAVDSRESEQQTGESCQGPHPWRKRLKPINTETTDAGEHERVYEIKTHVRRPSRDEKYKLNSGVRRESSFGKTRTSTNPGCLSPASSKRRSAVSSNQTESAFTRQIVNKPNSPGISRRRFGGNQQAPAQKLPIPAWNQHVAVGRTTAGEAPDTKKRVEKVLKARLYLLQQTGPNSFLIGGDSPDHKYRVIIGPQRCSCGRGPHCVHVLFVMLRVFQLNESDSCFWSSSLKNYEVETLFRTFHERRSSLLQNLSKKKAKQVKQEEVDEKKEEESLPSHLNGTEEHELETEGKDEEATCPICLLEMVEGESLTECVNGCQNKLHHHCIAVWFEECRRQNEPLICPLCRATWKVDNESPIGRDELAAPPNTRASSPQNVPEQDIMLPHADPIAPEHQNTAAPWIPVLGEDLVACLFSKNWMVREIALKQLGRVAIGALLLGVGEGRSGVMVSPTRQATTRAMLECCCSVIAYMCADPVYKVFVSGLRTLRTVLAYTPCRDEAQQQRLQNLLRPVIDTILWKCADSNKRTSQLSISGLQELVKGQDGELAVGKEIYNPGHHCVGTISYLLSCITQEYDSNTQWQWLLGRLFMLLKLLEEYPSDFVVQPPNKSDGDVRKSMSLDQYINYTRIMNILSFTKPALDNSHQKVARTARKVFYLIARLQAQNAGILKCVMDMLEGLSLDLQVHLKRRLLRMAAEFNIAQHVMNVMNPDFQDEDDPSPLFTTPILSGNCSPRSASPSPHISVTVNNFVSGSMNFPPFGHMAPPNSPARRKGPIGKSNTASNNTSVATQDCDEASEELSTDAGSSHNVTTTSTPVKIPNNTMEDTPGVSLSPSPVRSKSSDRVLVDACIATSPMLAIRGLPSGCSEVDDLTYRSTEDLNMTLNTVDADTQTDDELEKTDDEVDKTDDEMEKSNNQRTKCETDTGSTIDDLSLCSANATAASTSGLTEDLTDLALSSANEDHVSFKTEVANASPQRTHSCDNLVNADDCHCKEEVELEEAQALVEAMEQSVKDQNALPFVPGLSRKESTDTLTIHIQDEQVNDSAHSYLEDVHWKRGMMLGTGGFSTCYQAWDFKTGTIMCVKQISFCRNSQSEQDNVIDAIKDEIQMMARLNHPNVVRILGATQQGCHFFMFVEWMPGGSVALLLERFGAFEEPVLVNYTQQTLRGLAYLHDCQILHRDLKGANLLIDSTGKRLRIGDFGAAARLASRSTVAGEFQGQLLGTIAFMAPEVLRGENYGRSCDVWSVGCTMIEMSTTKPPWGASAVSNHLALIFKIASSSQPPPIPDNLSPPVRDLLLRCLETERVDRPPAKELLKHPLFTMFQKH